MGISGLLPQLKSVTAVATVRELRGLRVAVDGYGWLHRGVHGCATDLGMGKSTDRYITFVINRVDALVSQGVRVLMVFDGGPLPSKSGTEDERAESREKARQQALDMMRHGNLEGARQAFAKSIDVSPEMAARVIDAMRRKWGEGRGAVDWIVAPYEADAQLAYLAKEGLVDAVISEDSDNLPFGVGRVVFKWDGFQGEQVIKHLTLFDLFSSLFSYARCSFRGFLGWAMGTASICRALPKTCFLPCTFLATL